MIKLIYRGRKGLKVFLKVFFFWIYESRGKRTHDGRDLTAGSQQDQGKIEGSSLES